MFANVLFVMQLQQCLEKEPVAVTGTTYGPLSESSPIARLVPFPDDSDKWAFRALVSTEEEGDG